MKTPPRLLSIYNTTMTQGSTQDVLAHTNGKCTSMGKGKNTLKLLDSSIFTKNTRYCSYTQGILLYSHSARICGNAVGLKYPLVSVVNGEGMPKSLQAISNHISSVRIRRPPNLIPKMAIQSRRRTAYCPQLR